MSGNLFATMREIEIISTATGRGMRTYPSCAPEQYALRRRREASAPVPSPGADASRAVSDVRCSRGRTDLVSKFPSSGMDWIKRQEKAQEYRARC